METCDGFFEREGIPYSPEFQDAAVYAVYSADFFDPYYKKWLILCWFDETYGEWNGSRYNLRDSRTQASSWLELNGYDTFESFLEDINANSAERKNR